MLHTRWISCFAGSDLLIASVTSVCYQIPKTFILREEVDSDLRLGGGFRWVSSIGKN